MTKAKQHLLVFLVFYLLLTFMVISCSSSKADEEVNRASNRDRQLNTLASQIIENLKWKKKKPKIAVANFTDIDGKERKLGKFISVELISRLYKTRKVKVIEREKLNNVLKENKLSSSALFNHKTTKKLGKLLGADAIVIGAMTDIGKYININARVIDVETGEVSSVGTIKLLKDNTVSYLWEGKNGKTDSYEISKQGQTSAQAVYKKEGSIHIVTAKMLSYKYKYSRAYTTANSQNLKLSNNEIQRLKEQWLSGIIQVHSKIKQLDVCIVLDSTGSMADEILAVKVEIKNMIDELRKKFSNWKIRASIVSYRDLLDEYVVKLITLTPDISKIYGFLSAINAAGGDDGPEALIEALDRADKINWNPQAVKMAVILTDAPSKKHPQIGYNQIVERMLAKKIKIYTYLCSGIPSEAIEEYKWLASSTDGKMRFLKYYSIKKIEKTYAKRYGKRKAKRMAKEAKRSAPAGVKDVPDFGDFEEDAEEEMSDME